MAVTADEAGQALRVIGRKLLDAGVVTVDGMQVLEAESFKLGKLKRGTAWAMEVGRGRPIVFERVIDKTGQPVTITLSAERIVVDQSEGALPPFSKLDVAIALTDAVGEPVCRWPLDRANTNQNGPLFHLQYGGHLPGFRDREMPFDEPRWCHPPMELGLLCEMITANFFHAQWVKSLRDDLSWCRAVQSLQRLCYSAYAAQMVRSLEISDSTALARMWNGRWV